jgi:hypothetical protein
MPSFDRTTMCNECPFRADSPRGWLGPLTVDDLEEAALGASAPGIGRIGDVGTLICHKDIAALEQQGLSEDAIQAAGQQCVGMIRYANACFKLAHDPVVAAYQKKLKSIEDEPVIPARQLREHHTLPTNPRKKR